MNTTVDFRVTYDIVTPESVESGDTAESGFVLSDGSHVEVTHVQEVWQSVGMTLRQAIGLIGCVEKGGNGSYYETDGHNDRTGDHETRALHLPDNITAASQRRVECILRKERLL